jgi:hypothetical protein
MWEPPSLHRWVGAAKYALFLLQLVVYITPLDDLCALCAPSREMGRMGVGSSLYRCPLRGLKIIDFVSPFLQRGLEPPPLRGGRSKAASKGGIVLRYAEDAYALQGPHLALRAVTSSAGDPSLLGV